jgi:hypothetical protein
VAVRTAVANIAVLGALAVGAAVASLATAAADPPPPDPVLLPVDPAAPAPPPPPGPSIPVLGANLGPAGFNILAQNGSDPAPGSLGVPQTLDTNPQSLLGQNVVPSAPGQGVPGAPVNLDPLNNAYVMPQNEKPAAPGQGAQVGVAPGEENDHLGRVDYLKQWHDLYKNGNLKGALLGQAPQEQLGEPLPGTAPPPGTNIPPGLEQYLPDPNAPAVPDPNAPILPIVPPPAG